MKIQRSFIDQEQSGKLFLVPTPIGNLADFTFRARETLNNVDLIFSEDTRNTLKLLNHYQIKKKQISFHQHNFRQRIPQILKLLSEGKQIAQVSDAGMPLLSDPGQELVEACLQQNFPVISLPGAMAGITALIASGLLAQPFIFQGFLPRKKKEQINFLEDSKNIAVTQIFYESPFRIKETLKNIEKIYGKSRLVVLCRELTKIYEEYLRGSCQEILQYLEENVLKGEICLLVSGQDSKDVLEEENDFSIKDQVNQILAESNLSVTEAIKKVAKLRNLSRKEVYREYHELPAVRKHHI